MTVSNYPYEKATRARWRENHQCSWCGEPAQYEGDGIYRDLCPAHLKARREWQREYRRAKVKSL